MQIRLIIVRRARDFAAAFAGGSAARRTAMRAREFRIAAIARRRASIDASLMGEEKDMLEDLVAAAMNDAVRRVELTTQEKMGGLTAGMPMPPGFKLPF